MNKISKTLSPLIIILMLLLNLSFPVFAEDSVVVFKGQKEDFTFGPGSGYHLDDMFDGFKNITPGDKRTETITIKNESKDSDYIKVYLQIVTDNPLSYDEDFEFIDGKDEDAVVDDDERDETVDSMKDFLNQIDMKIYNDNELIYSGTCGSASDEIYIDTLRRGETDTLKVDLQVPITLGNEYSNRVGEVDWLFTSGAFNDEDTKTYKNLTVHKIWDDSNNPNRPEKINIQLLRNGVLHEEIELKESNQWTHTWSKLEEDYNWSAVESNVPEGYESKSITEGNTVHITNKIKQKALNVSVPPSEPVSLTVRKQWSLDDKPKNRPTSVSVTLYNSNKAVETVSLSSANNWSHTWSNLDVSGNWSVLEVIPKGYSPSYSVDGNVVTITNTAVLIQTGQMNLPILIFAGLGIVLIIIGLIFILKKRKNDNV